MSLVPLLLQALVEADGDAVVVHSGETPYVDAPSGQTELSQEPLPLHAVTALLTQLLPAESQQTFQLLGAIRHECPPMPAYPGEQFVVVAFREADDLWVEIRREGTRKQAPPAVAPIDAAGDDIGWTDRPAASDEAADPSLLLPDAEELWPGQSRERTLSTEPWSSLDLPDIGELDEPHPSFDPGVRELEPLPAPGRSMFDLDDLDEDLGPDLGTPVRAQEPPSFERFASPPIAEMPSARDLHKPLDLDDLDALDIGLDPFERPEAAAPPPVAGLPGPRHLPEPPALEGPGAIDLGLDLGLDLFERVEAPPPAVEERPRPAAPPPPPPPPVFEQRPRAIAPPPPPPAAVPPQMLDEPDVREPMVASVEPETTGRPAVVLPMARHTIRQDVIEPIDTLAGGLDRLLRIVAARGGSTLYVTSGAQPSMRIDGEIHTIDGESVLSSAEAETLVLGVVPERTREALRAGSRTEWMSEVPDLGRVRCVTFRDHRGAGGIFRIVSARPASAEQLGMTREVQALALEAEGLVLVVGPRSSGKSTLIAAFVDLINRTRRDHVITVENEIQVVHESQGSMISQREMRGDNRELLAVVRTALREDPDVLVIEDLRGDALVHLAVEAAGSGRLVIAGLSAHSTADAVDRVIDEYSPEERRHAQLALAENLRGVIGQVLLRKPGGGRLAAREVLLNTPAVASLIADGKTSQLPLAIDAGRKVGMISLNESLVALVKNGAVDAAEAYRRTGDRRGLLALLKRHGIDTSLLERLASSL